MSDCSPEESEMVYCSKGKNILGQIPKRAEKSQPHI